MTKEIPLTQGKVALVDDEDYERLMQIHWCAMKRSKGLFHAVSAKRFGKMRIYMHRYITDAGGDKQVDHINHNGLDNRRCNLRVVTHQQNVWNMSKRDGTSRYKGVCFSIHTKGRPWLAQIGITNGKHRTINLGRFTTEEEAARAYDEASLKYHGEFGKRNFER